MRRLQRDPKPRPRGAQILGPSWGSSGLIPTQLNPNEWGAQSLVFWGRDTSEPLLSLNDEGEEKLRKVFRDYSEAVMRSLKMAMDVFSQDIPRVFQVRI
jgi:hypothetical protein